MPDDTTMVIETPDLVISRDVAAGMVMLKAELADPNIGAALREASGVAVPPPLTAVTAEGPVGMVTAVWMAPDEVLLMLPEGRAAELSFALDAALAGTVALALDMSDARAVFRLDGARWREVVAKGAPVDLRPAAFPAGRARRTHLGQVAVAFWADPADAAQVTLVCFRSVADDVSAWLAEAAAPSGAVGLFADA
ncbi:MAG: sarcosine oxidase subunit gamma family protein [Pseudomonadota bacterium]